jgi:hypothetical protein
MLHYSQLCTKSMSILLLYFITMYSDWPQTGDRWVGVQVPIGSRIFISPYHSDRLWGPPSLPSNGYERTLPKIKRPGRETDHSSPYSAEAKKTLLYTLTTLSLCTVHDGQNPGTCINHLFRVPCDVCVSIW